MFYIGQKVVYIGYMNEAWHPLCKNSLYTIKSITHNGIILIGDDSFFMPVKVEDIRALRANDYE